MNAKPTENLVVFSVKIPASLREKLVDDACQFGKTLGGIVQAIAEEHYSMKRECQIMVYRRVANKSKKGRPLV